MAELIRVVRAAGAEGSALLTGIYAGISKRPGDEYRKGKRSVYVPATQEVLGFDAGGPAQVEVPGFLDLVPTIEVRRMTRRIITDRSRGAGSIFLLDAAGDVSNEGSFEDTTTTAQGTLASAVLGANLDVTGTILLSLTPVETALHVRLPARHTGSTGGGTKDTSGVGDNSLRVRVGGGIARNLVVTSGAAVTNDVLLRELMQAAAAAGLDLFFDLDTLAIRIASPLGASFEILASGLATVLGFTLATYTPTIRGSVNEPDFDTHTGTTITVLGGNSEFPTGTADEDFCFVSSNGQLAQSTVTYDSVDFDLDFVIVSV